MSDMVVKTTTCYIRLFNAWDFRVSALSAEMQTWLGEREGDPTLERIKRVFGVSTINGQTYVGGVDFETEEDMLHFMLKWSGLHMSPYKCNHTSYYARSRHC